MALSGGVPIGGAHYLIELEDKRIVIDCGAVQKGGKVLPPPIAEGRIDALLVTHGHLDHIGMLPLFAREHPDTPIYGTKVTWRFARMLLWDSYRVAFHKLDRGEKVETYFSYSDITNALSLKRFRLVHNPEWFSPWPGWKIRFRSSGHINGAASIDIVSPKGFRIIHSGDISFINQPTIKGAEIANDFISPEVLITEGTYGDRDLPNRVQEEHRFVDKVVQILGRGGKVLVPSFSITGPNIGIILANGLAKAKVDIPVHIDGMIRTAAGIINGSNEWSPNDDGLAFPKNLFAVTEDPEKARAYRQKLIEGGPAVVVSSHGMLEGGLAMFYLPHILADYKSAVLLPGYQAEGTGGRKLLELERGNQFGIGRMQYPIYCDVKRFQLSSHASGNELAGWISEIQPWSVIVIHAGRSAFEGLKQKIKERHPAIAVSGGFNGEDVLLD
ncbi:MAG: MBL fold metallo-hydrolase [bacterium]|nr:MBL fold metallo-hydrolase [bacterium]